VDPPRELKSLCPAFDEASRAVRRAPAKSSFSLPNPASLVESP